MLTTYSTRRACDAVTSQSESCGVLATASRPALEDQLRLVLHPAAHPQNQSPAHLAEGRQTDRRPATWSLLASSSAVFCAEQLAEVVR
jgi:hypothetical protein